MVKKYKISFTSKKGKTVTFYANKAPSVEAIVPAVSVPVIKKKGSGQVLSSATVLLEPTPAQAVVPQSSKKRGVDEPDWEKLEKQAEKRIKKRAQTYKALIRNLEGSRMQKVLRTKASPKKK